MAYYCQAIRWKSGKPVAYTDRDMEKDELRDWRERRLKMTQAQLAAALGVHPMTVSKWERGERGIPEMVRLALERLAELPGAPPVCENCGMRHAPDDTDACIEGHGDD